MPSYVVVGASKGIGLEFVAQLAKSGNQVFALARNPDESKGLQALASTPGVTLIKADTTEPASLKAAAEQVAHATGGSLDVLINNAVYRTQYRFTLPDQYPSEDVLIDDFMTSFKTNTVGPILATNAFLPLIRKGTLKKVLSLSSAAADPAFIAKAEEASAPSYCITKTGIEMVMLTYALEYKREGVVFLAISPGIVNTADAPPPPDVLPKILAMRAAFQRVAPHWTGPMQPEESVRLMLGVLDRATIEDSGSFVSHLGTRQWL